MKKTKLLSFVLAAAMLAIPLAGCSQDEGADGGKETIKIGGLAHLSGDVSQDGVAVHRFHAVVLFHQRRLDVFGLFGFLFCQGSSIFYWIDRTVKLAIFRQKIARRN